MLVQFSKHYFWNGAFGCMAFLGKKACPLGNNQVSEIIVCLEEGGGRKCFEETTKAILSFQH